MKAPSLRRRTRGFTLVEIMIVVLVVGLLSALAVAAIHHIKDRAVRSLIQNNLRQLHTAKEQFFLETGINQGTTPIGLANKGYLRKSVSDHVMSGGTFEAHMGWNYLFILMPGEPTYAYQGQDPGDPDPHSRLTVMQWKQPTGEVIWYPAPPAGLAGRP
jgi:prepilin-type N-terminal cleavage/methylation domain-containing protein